MTLSTHYVDEGGAPALRITGRDLAALPKELRRRLAPKLAAAGERVRAEAASNAAWSSRIPPALSLKVSFSKGTPGVTIVADAAAAPHARAFEGMVQRTFRHPVFQVPGRDVVWVTQDTRPFLRPAVQSVGARFVDDVVAAVDEALDATGFKH